jgi:hypothetical protein
MALISELPMFEVALKAEEKHGTDTHMAIEVVLKPEYADLLEGDDPYYNPADVEEDHVMWWVEFENDIKIFDDFLLVEHYLLNEAVKTGNGPKVIYTDEELNDDDAEESNS